MYTSSVVLGPCTGEGLVIKSCININHFKRRRESIGNASYYNFTHKAEIKLLEFWNSLEYLVVVSMSGVACVLTQAS